MAIYVYTTIGIQRGRIRLGFCLLANSSGEVFVTLGEPSIRMRVIAGKHEPLCPFFWQVNCQSML